MPTHNARAQRDYPKLFVGGRWMAPIDGGRLEVRSPHDRSLTGVAALATPRDVDAAVATARKAFDDGPWPRMTPARRQIVIKRFDDLLSRHQNGIADLITAENGTPRWFTGWCLAAMPLQTDAFLRAAETLPWEQELPDGHTVVRREPVGVVAAVIPWNMPNQSALVKVIPALLAGCTVVLKVAPETPLDGLALGDLFTEAGLPEGVLSILPAARATSQYLVGHPDVDKIAFTGSTQTGRTIAAIAGQQLKRVSLELGGKSASIVLPDADLDGVTEGMKLLAYGNNGESCVAHSRLLVPRSRQAEMEDRLREMVAAIVVGDPFDDNTFIGPLVRADHADRVRSHITAGILGGARLIAGGPDAPAGLGQGCYVKPTLLTDVDNAMPIAREEIFGPVLVLIPYDTEADAVRIANDSPYGLGGGVWTSDAAHGLEIARQIRTGTFQINGAAHSLEAPAGGYRNSGIGREFGLAGLEEYLEYKTINR
ncbi:aldehyde dehydrogenase [Kutzneria sp. CA-103260]|uniref:aldehyde dehydrogenase n=1 Tax=Kutzneria sp. CA-103260 TaxID=2802641 RepID=UPI001BAC78ED|nr:aldehyde dehydrogenase [Kutzneria sp. CA-103260]QUQ72407.1 aldehyde dehydrogenase family protein [Kutzneria sp. CA-103260]